MSKCPLLAILSIVLQCTCCRVCTAGRWIETISANGAKTGGTEHKAKVQNMAMTADNNRAVDPNYNYNKVQPVRSGGEGRIGSGNGSGSGGNAEHTQKNDNEDGNTKC